MKHLIPICLLLALVSCTGLPDEYKEATGSLNIYPEYQSVYIPYNIAPLNFHISNEASSYLTSIRSKNGKSLLIRGKDVQIKLKDWKKLLESNKGEVLFIDVYVKQNDVWKKYPAIQNYIVAEPIDNYVVYRYIEPLYTTYEDMAINQRNLENFDIKVLYDNRLLSVEKKAQCVNCHSFQDYNRTDKMQLHIRGDRGGTIIIEDGQYKKFNLKAEGLVGGAVYPSWHPTLNLIAYSVNKIGQNFYTKNPDKVEVMDDKSDLIVYDVDNNQIIPVEPTANWLETFPYWSPDGKYLYYTAAHFIPSMMNTEADVIIRYNTIRYNLVRKPFYAETKTFGPADTLISASSIGKSASFPRVSPDGNYLLFTMANFGNFHIWHKSSDLYLMDLKSRTYRNVAEINSPDVESYHSWSSSGRWIIYSSRRDNGGYTRLYVSYFDANGVFHKPFVIPQKDPAFYKRSFKSFNIPEFTVKSAPANRNGLVNAIKGETINANLKQ